MRIAPPWMETRFPFRCPRFRWRMFAVTPFLLALTALAVLRFGSPQWHKYIFLFQADVWPGDRQRMQFPPVDRVWANSPRSGFLQPSLYTGVWRTWDEEGRLHGIQHWKHGLPHGRWAEFFCSGFYFGRSIYWERHYDCGSLHGPSRGTEGLSQDILGDPNNPQLSLTKVRQHAWKYGNYRNGRKDGEWTIIDTLDRVRETTFYKAGVAHGPSRTWHTNGQIAWDKFYLDGKPVGRWVYYDSEGNVQRIADNLTPETAYFPERFDPEEPVFEEPPEVDLIDEDGEELDAAEAARRYTLRFDDTERPAE